MTTLRKYPATKRIAPICLGTLVFSVFDRKNYLDEEFRKMNRGGERSKPQYMAVSLDGC
jgi:hypothetical protein